jgi:hypothetical protein
LAKTYGLIGVYSRIVNKIEDSKKYLSLAIEMNIQSGNHKSLFVNELRLAHTHINGKPTIINPINYLRNLRNSQKAIPNIVIIWTSYISITEKTYLTKVNINWL